MKELEHYSAYDTVEVSYPHMVNNGYKLKSFLLSYHIHAKTDEYYSDVFVGLTNKKIYTFMGDNVILKTTRMVLNEKYDYRLMGSTKFILPGFSSKKYSFEL